MSRSRLSKAADDDDIICVRELRGLFLEATASSGNRYASLMYPYEQYPSPTIAFTSYQFFLVYRIPNFQN